MQISGVLGKRGAKPSHDENLSVRCPFPPDSVWLSGPLSGFVYTPFRLHGKRVEDERGGTQDGRLPITLSIMWRMRAVLSPSASNPDTKIIWAACCLGFVRGLRVGEMTAPDQGMFDPSVHQISLWTTRDVHYSLESRSSIRKRTTFAKECSFTSGVLGRISVPWRRH